MYPTPAVLEEGVNITHCAVYIVLSAASSTEETSLLQFPVTGHSPLAQAVETHALYCGSTVFNPADDPGHIVTLCTNSNWLRTGLIFFRYQLKDDVFQELVGFWINNLFMRVPNSVVLPVGTHTDCCTEEEVGEKKRDIMSKIQAMQEERSTNLAHFINNLESSEESEFYVDQWDKLKEMESCTLTVGLLIGCYTAL